jgi:hypothetical protein
MVPNWWFEHKSDSKFANEIVKNIREYMIFIKLIKEKNNDSLQIIKHLILAEKYMHEYIIYQKPALLTITEKELLKAHKISEINEALALHLSKSIHKYKKPFLKNIDDKEKEFLKKDVALNEMLEELLQGILSEEKLNTYEARTASKKIRIIINILKTVTEKEGLIEEQVIQIIGKLRHKN